MDSFTFDETLFDSPSTVGQATLEDRRIAKRRLTYRRNQAYIKFLIRWHNDAAGYDKEEEYYTTPPTFRQWVLSIISARSA